MTPVLSEQLKRLDRNQAAILTLYTGRICGPWHDAVELAEKLLNTSGICDIGMCAIADRLRELVEPMFMEIVHDPQTR